MPDISLKYGIVVGIDGSAESDAAIRWAAREAMLRRAPITLVHVVVPLVIAWPVGRIKGNVTEWEHDNARYIVEQARKTVEASLTGSDKPDVHTEMLYSQIVPALVDKSKQAQMTVVGRRGQSRLRGFGWARSGPACFTMATVRSRSSSPRNPRQPMPRYWWASTRHLPQKPPPRWLSRKHRASGLIWWHCMRGVMSGSSPRTGRATKRRGGKCLTSAWPPAGKGIPKWGYGNGWCVTIRRAGWSRSPSTVSWWWSEATAAAGSRACCWARSARRWRRRRRLR